MLEHQWFEKFDIANYIAWPSKLGHFWSFEFVGNGVFDNNDSKLKYYQWRKINNDFNFHLFIFNLEKWCVIFFMVVTNDDMLSARLCKNFSLFRCTTTCQWSWRGMTYFWIRFHKKMWIVIVVLINQHTSMDDHLIAWEDVRIRSLNFES